MTRIDDLGNGYKIIQNPDGFCFGTDSVLLSDFAVVKPNQKVVDLCSGNGIIPILLCAKSKVQKVIGIEIQKEPYKLAQESKKLNNLDDRVEFINDDLNNSMNHFEYNSIDVITCNPPYMLNGSGYKNDTDTKTIARHEILVNIDDIARISSKLLKFGGKIYMVHRCDRLCDVICAFRKYGIEPKRLQMVHPYMNSAPNLFLVEGMSGGNPSLKLENPIYMYKEKENG